MKVFLVSCNSLPASPSGPAYVAGAVRQAGHQVEVYDALFAVDLESELIARLDAFRPDVVGISIRLVFGDTSNDTAPFGTRHIDLRPRVREIVEVVRRHSPARIVLGGPGFNYYARAWLEYLDLDFGIRGEGEEAFPLFLRRLAEGKDIYTVPGCVAKVQGEYRATPSRPVTDLDNSALPAYDLFDQEPYTACGVTPAVFTKRGCAFACSYCPWGKLEGKHYRLKSPGRVLAEVRHIRTHTSARRIRFCDNNFNVPRRHAEAICRALAAEGLDIEWGTGDLRPVGVTDEFCRLLEDSGCFYVNLSIESASDTMLQRLRRGYTVRQVRRSLEALARSQVPFAASLMLGAPGETPETVAETLTVLGDYHVRVCVWVTIGVYLWTDYQDIAAEALTAGLLNDPGQLFRGAVYLSPALQGAYLQELLGTLRSRPGYDIQVNRPSEGWTSW